MSDQEDEKTSSLLPDSLFDRIFYRGIGKIFSHYPFMVLLATLSISVTLTCIGLSHDPLPEFGDPYLGFETRFTPISNRIVAFDNFREEINRLNFLENYPGEKSTRFEETRRKKRKKRSSLCSNSPNDDYGRVAFKIKDGNITGDILKKLCFIQKIIESDELYKTLCELDDDLNCCPSWSIPNYASKFLNISSCDDIRDFTQVEEFYSALKFCTNLYSNSSQNEACVFKTKDCPEVCKYGGSIYYAVQKLMSVHFFSKEDSAFALLILPIPKGSLSLDILEAFLESINQMIIPGDEILYYGSDFGIKEDLFKKYLLSDLRYALLASTVIFLIVTAYTKSLFTTLISFSVLGLSLGISYFIYVKILAISYFPFMNMLATIILLGIGTDSTLIFSIVWQRLKSENRQNGKDDDFHELIFLTLKETTTTLLITTCTTSGAFFASLNSSITTIRCFSIFSGTSIIASFILLYICVPTSLVLSDKLYKYFLSTFLQTETVSYQQPYDKNTGYCSEKYNILLDHLTRFTIRISESSRFWTVTFIISLTFLVLALFIIFISPGYKLPNSEQFQLLHSNHPFEKYESQVSKSFSVEEDELKITLYFIWGVVPDDNGDSLDPNNHGYLKLDDSFQMASPENQRWLRKFCRRIEMQNFYDSEINTALGYNFDSCFIETMISWMKRDCEHPINKSISNYPCCKRSKFPYDEKTFSQCIGLVARDIYRTPSFYFKPDIAGPKFFHDNNNQNIEIENTTKYLSNLPDKPKNKLRRNDSSSQMIIRKGNKYKGGQKHVEILTNKSLATFTIRIKTKAKFSLIYETTSSFYDEVDKFFAEAIKDAPKELRNGFFISPSFEFFDLQSKLLEETVSSLFISIGLCFLFIWISSWSFIVALGAILTLLAIVTVTSGFLTWTFDWKLGVFESISVTVAVGLSDFTAHHALEFSKRNSVLSMTSPTFFSALSTIIMGLCMAAFSNVLVYEQIGYFFFSLVLISWLYSIFFLSPILIALQHCCSYVRLSRRGESRSSINDIKNDDDEDIVILNENTLSYEHAQKIKEKKKLLKTLKKCSQETPV